VELTNYIDVLGTIIFFMIVIGSFFLFVEKEKEKKEK
jgi:cbb3-type cytochrome oxidase subunit 3